jgi:AraC-like DNA-binding protein
MQKITFSSQDLAVELDDRARFSLWRERYTAAYGSLDLARSEDLPFFMRFDYAQFGPVGVGRLDGTINRFGRTRRDVARDQSDDFCICLNCGGSKIALSQVGREAALDRGMMTLLSSAEPGEGVGQSSNSWFMIRLPRRLILDLMVHAEDRIAAPVLPGKEATRHIRRYLNLVLSQDGIMDEPALTGHVGTTLVDLVALALGSRPQAAELARARGLRAARLQEILSIIQARFSDGSFSSNGVAAQLGLSPRYVQELLHEGGASFTDRVLELRLQKARAMLASRKHDHLKVSDIAYACGFNDLSYFNHRFRARFGAAPNDFRGGRR